MPFVLSPIIMLGSAGMWLEGAAYEKKNIYSISKGKLPPVNYDEHVLRPHSLTHLETPAHTIPNAPRIEAYFQNDLKHFFGKTTVIKLPGNKYESKGGGVYHWIVSKKEIELALQDTGYRRLKSFQGIRIHRILSHQQRRIPRSKLCPYFISGSC